MTPEDLIPGLFTGELSLARGLYGKSANVVMWCNLIQPCETCPYYHKDTNCDELRFHTDWHSLLYHRFPELFL